MAVVVTATGLVTNGHLTNGAANGIEETMSEVVSTAFRARKLRIIMLGAGCVTSKRVLENEYTYWLSVSPAFSSLMR